MSYVSLVFGQGFAQSSIGAVTLDALLGETTELNSRATEYVVEDGPPVTDHIVQDSERLQLTGWITAADLTLFGAQGRTKLVSAKAALRRIHAERLPVAVATGMDVYADMAMETCKIERTNEGDFFSVQCGFRKIRKVALRMADIPPDKVSAAAKGKAGQTRTNAGKADTPEATPKQQSDLFRILK
ncbi:phage baseplate protein [Bordetella petrii]|uniref:Dit-like phage tail protein N-terminal domain-containing protein n=1 Tax=Bordetella petrii (strain ATCC BAA-461 / DSM 12804 / CCUG 43448 / CIP 107267 / Se-1111R) TaxID=340100 RepID=A9I936_BORPD|nr:hypothetical protein [Bordetella petrii]CAP41323.1 hypothetical protein predicted by Glimmer/Critica [Bordetella petrii]